MKGLILMNSKLSKKELFCQLHNAITGLYTEEKNGGILTMPTTYSKSLQDKISNIARIEDCLYKKVMKEDEGK